MTRSRIEGLLTAFSKLITKDKQHTFIETDSVRYVYQALMDRLYCVLITTKTSNILEDLETLRLFVRVINEYTSDSSKSGSDEQAVLDNAFTLIFAFDEIVALGYRESVNLSQVRTFIEMDSHEERVYVAVRQTQEREAKQKMRERAKELSKQQKTMALSKGIGSSASMSQTSISAANEIKAETFVERIPSASTAPSYTASRPKGTSKALKLGGKGMGSSFLPPEAEEQLATELAQDDKPIGSSSKSATTKAVANEPVQITVEEKLKCEISRDGGTLSTCEVSGTVLILVREEAYINSKIQIECEDEHVQMQTHPNVDKELFKSSQTIGLRNKTFPVNNPVGVIKFKRSATSTSEDWPPLVVTVWPNGNNCNIEVQANRDLQDVKLMIPCPSSSSPVVNDCQDGEYEWKRGVLSWFFAVLPTGSGPVTMDFDLEQTLENDQFFPVKASFQLEDANLSGISVVRVGLEEDGNDEGHWSLTNKLTVDKYDIV